MLRLKSKYRVKISVEQEMSVLLPSVMASRLESVCLAHQVKISLFRKDIKYSFFQMPVELLGHSYLINKTVKNFGRELL